MKDKGAVKEVMETASVFIQLSSFYLAPVLSALLIYYFFYHTCLWPLIAVYLVWIYIDRNSCSTDGRTRTFLRHSFIWKPFREYFPQRMVKTVDLDPSSNYLFCFFPHGILATAALSHCANDTSKSSEFYPGFTFLGFTLNINFYIPFFRELAMGYGMRSVSKESMMYQLTSSKGKIMSLYPGGSAEAAKSEPGTYRLAIKNRKGFVKVALITGTNLVPVIAFGETDLYDHKIPQKGSLLEKIHTFLRKKTGVAPCLFLGRGFLRLLPYRKPVTSIVGKPLILKKNENPTNEEINKVHADFLSSLISLFEEHKAKYVIDPESTHLSIED